MRRILYIIAAATFAALLVVISAPAMAAAPSGDMGPSMGAPPDTSGSYQGGKAPQRFQRFAPGSGPMSEGMTGQSGYQGPGEQSTYGYDQPPSGGGTGYGKPAGRGGPSQGSTGGEAVVIGVDRPENCLRIRKGPSTSYEQVGCAKMGARLRLTGVFSSDNRWAQLDDNGWVFTCQIKTNLKPPGPPVACGGGGGSYEIWSGPAGYYSEDFSGPTYLYGGYGPYWYGRRFHHHHHHMGHQGMHSGHSRRR